LAEKAVSLQSDTSPKVLQTGGYPLPKDGLPSDGYFLASLLVYLLNFECKDK
jgi:hypothetical protein